MIESFPGNSAAVGIPTSAGYSDSFRQVGIRYRSFSETPKLTFIDLEITSTSSSFVCVWGGGAVCFQQW